MTREERHIAVLNRMLESMDVYDSIQPTTERKKAIKAAIQALSQEPICDRDCEHCTWTECPIEPCDDVISRDMALEKMADYVASGYADSSEDFAEYSRIICQLPSVTQKSGKWDASCTCSVCGQWRILESEKNSGKYKFCPSCGAKMVEPQESEE